MTTATATKDLSQARQNSGGSDPSTAQRVAEKAHKKIDEVAEMAEGVENTARSKAAEASERAQDVSEQAQAAGEEALQKAQKAVEKSPLAAAGIAFAVGFVVSALLRR